MARGRMIDMSMWSNENFAAMPAMGRLLLIGIITLADDQGRCKANPAYLRSQIFPYEDIATADIDWWIERMVDNETVISYTVDGKAYVQLVNWWTYQQLDWARPSDYPAPDGWNDRIRFNSKGNVNLTYNWCTKSGNRPADNCDSRGNPTQIDAKAPAQVGTKATTNAPTQASTQVNQLNLTQLKSSTADDALGLVHLIQAQGLGYIDNGAKAIAAQLIDNFGWDTCVNALDKLKAAHDKQVKGGRRGIVAPLAYLRTILDDESERNIESNKGFEANAWAQLNGVPDYMREE